MNCAECEALILDAADCGRSSAAIRAHLTECTSCRAFFDVQQAIHQLLRSGLSTVHVPGEFQVRIHRQLQLDRSLEIVRRAIAFLESATCLVLGGTVMVLSTTLTRLPWTNPQFYLPAIAVGGVLFGVREFLLGEATSD